MLRNERNHCRRCAATRDGTLLGKLTFIAAVIVEDVVTESAPTLLPVRAKEAVICGDNVKGGQMEEKKALQ